MVPYWNNEMRLAIRLHVTFSKKLQNQLISALLFDYKFSWIQLKTNLGFLKIRHEACSWDIEFLVFPFHFWEESFDEMFTLLVKFESTIIEQRSSNSIAAAATEQLLPSKVEEREWKWGGGNSCFLTPLEAVVESPYFFVFREEQQHPQKNYKDSSSRQEIFKNWYFTVCTAQPDIQTEKQFRKWLLLGFLGYQPGKVWKPFLDRLLLTDHENRALGSQNWAYE